MVPHEYVNNTNSRPATLSGNFTAEEVSRLTQLRSNFHAHSEYLERVIDERRLEFARWLLDHGKLSEACPEA
ncbi:MAG TPA: hypothetical protein VKT52_03365 [Ktedonobacterales bacterium]|jgi:hypothetical protein|nr:hypothetical protein [Ktedonobacterales bacterium]